MNPVFPGTQYPAQPAPSLSGDFETYQGFNALVLTYLDTDGADIKPSLVDSLILLGEKRINREIRCREMESPLAMRVDNGVCAVPGDYLELKHARVQRGIGRSQRIERVDNIDHSYAPNGFQIGPHDTTRFAYGPTVQMAREGDTFTFGMRLEDGAVVSGIYYVRFTPLKDRSDSLLDPDSLSYQRLYAEHPDLYLYAALEDAETLIGRPLRSQMWKGKYAELKAMLMMQSQQERFSGAPIRMRAR